MPADPLLDFRHLTDRDRTLLSWLAEHYVLATEHIAQGLFPSLRSAQARLRTLHRIGAVGRFAFASSDAETRSWRYTLGPLGLHLNPTQWHDPDHPAAKPPRSYVERQARIARSPRLNHLLGVNAFFTALHGVTRTDPDLDLRVWWSEQHVRAQFGHRSPRLRPDGYGIWSHHGRQVEFFLEHDRGTEPLPRVLEKLPAYERLAEQTGIARTLLLWVPDERRAQRLSDAVSGEPLHTPVAVAAHGPRPDEPVWRLPHTTELLPLHALPAARTLG